MNSQNIATRPTTARQIISDLTMTPDQREFLKLNIFPDSLTEKLHTYGRLLVESSKVSKSIKKKDKIINKNDLSISELPEEIQQIIEGEKTSRRHDLGSLYERSGALSEEFQNISTGIELIQLLDKFQKFLSDEDQSNLEQLSKKIDFINIKQILTNRYRESWPTELSKTQMRPLFEAYQRLMSEATSIAGRPIPVELNTPPKEDILSQENSHRTPSASRVNLIEHLTELGFDALAEDKRLQQISSKMIRHRLHKVKTITDLDETEFRETLNERPEIILEAQTYQQIVRRTKILREISLNHSYSGSKPKYDPQLAKSLFKLFKDELCSLSDKDAFNLLKTVRTLIRQEVDTSGIFVLPNNFKETVLAQSGLHSDLLRIHPLKDIKKAENPKGVIQFFKSKDFAKWREDPLTAELGKKLIMDKIRGKHVPAPREDWIKANFPSIASTMAMEEFKIYLNQLIEAREILTSGSNSKASLKAA